MIMKGEKWVEPGQDLVTHLCPCKGGILCNQNGCKLCRTSNDGILTYFDPAAHVDLCSRLINAKYIGDEINLATNDRKC